MSGEDGYLAIKYETLEQAATDLGAAFRAAKEAIEELRKAVKPDLDSWSSDARDYYDNVQQDWDNTFTRMLGVLEGATGHLQSAHELYTQVERQNVSIWH